MRVSVVDEHQKLLQEPYLVRLGGWTMERYLRETPEYQRWEFVRGEVVMHSPATAEHQDVVGFLLRLLGGYCEARGWGKVLMGPAAVQVLPGVIREPDVFVLPPEEVTKATGVPLYVRPALAIEVLSPATRTLDLREKAEEYALAGIPEYWAVDLGQKEFWAHRYPAGYGPRQERYAATPITSGKLESQGVPGFWVEVGWLFQSPLPPVAERLNLLLSQG